MYRYFFVLLCAGAVPLIVSFHSGLGIWKRWRALCETVICVMIVFGAWDIWAVGRGHWRFDAESVCGVFIFSLPVEEWFFLGMLSFCCIVIWEALLFARAQRAENI